MMGKNDMLDNLLMFQDVINKTFSDTSISRRMKPNTLLNLSPIDEMVATLPLIADDNLELIAACYEVAEGQYYKYFTKKNKLRSTALLKLEE